MATTVSSILHESPPSIEAAARWKYHHRGAWEFAYWQGHSREALKPHFHEEAQIVLVLSGFRTFCVDNIIWNVTAGHGIYLPPRSVHSPLAITAATTSFNAYVAGRPFTDRVRAFSIRDHWLTEGLIGMEQLWAFLQSGRTISPIASDNRCAKGAAGFERARHAAARLGISRETYCRTFKRRTGLSPHAFEILTRLNSARQLLRTGESPAAAAAAVGFADQSHLGRYFIRTFGTTPGSYRRSMR